MATPPIRQWGVTPPISTVLPTKDEISANDDLIAELKAQNNFEQPTETEQRCVCIIWKCNCRKADDHGSENKCFSYSSVLQWSLFKLSVARRDFRLLLLKLQEARYSLMEVIDWVFMDQVQQQLYSFWILYPY